MRMVRGWKKDEFATPDIIWNIRLEGTYTEKRKGIEKECKLSGTAVKLTYIFLARYLDIYGDVFPSVDTIAKFTEQSSKNAQRCIAYLEKIRLLKKVPRYNALKMQTSNEYILFHPAQVPGLEWIEKPNNLGMDVTSYPENQGLSYQGMANLNNLSTDVTSYPESRHGRDVLPENTGVSKPQSANPSKSGTDVASPYNTSSSNFNISSSSVLDDPSFQKLSQAWKDCFQGHFDEDLEEWEFLQLMKLRDLDFILGQLKLIKEHHDISSIDSPYAFVSSCLKKKNGYKVPKKKRPAEKKAEKKKAPVSKKGKPSDLPKAIQEQLDQEEGQQQPVPQNETDKAQRRIQLMQERAKVKKKLDQAYSHGSEEEISRLSAQLENIDEQIHALKGKQSVAIGN